MTAAKVTPRIRQLVLERDVHACVRCGAYLAFKPYSLHHRTPRGSGGSRLPYINQPANLLVLCGHATTPGGCHTRIESHRTVSEANGYIVRRPTLPATVPVLTHQGWVLLDDGGGVTVVDPERVSASVEGPL